MGKKGFCKFLTGAAIGGALGVLFAPKKGSESREDLKNKACDAVDKLKKTDYEEVMSTIEKKFNDLKKEIKDLDKEKVLNIAQEKGELLKQKANDIVNIAIEKGSPVVQDFAEDAKKKTINLLNATIKKLEVNDSEKDTKKSPKTTKKN